MKRDEQGLPVVGHSSSHLGVRPGIDILTDAGGHVILDGKGVSVAPEWRLLPFSRIPRRLKDKYPGAAGANGCSCFRLGSGPFERGPMAEGLELIPDFAKHGVIAPAESVPLAAYESQLAVTRELWMIDEN